jgi:hypothetical protein
MPSATRAPVHAEPADWRTNLRVETGVDTRRWACVNLPTPEVRPQYHRAVCLRARVAVSWVCYKVMVSDRKYRQRGYMQEEGREEKRPSGGPPRERPEGPRGRGLGAPTATVFRCRMCGTRQQLTGPLSFDATCTSCSNDLHTCSNCVHFDTSKPNECRKPVVQRVTNKSKRNTCELFTPNTVQEFASDRSSAVTGGTPASNPRAAFDALFKKK